MMIVVERLDNGDITFGCSVCPYRKTLPHAHSSRHYLIWCYLLGSTLMRALYHNSSHIRPT